MKYHQQNDEKPSFVDTCKCILADSLSKAPFENNEHKDWIHNFPHINAYLHKDWIPNFPHINA